MQSGKVIGMTYATYNSTDAQNLNYAINVDLLKQLYKKLKNNNGNSLVESQNQIEQFDSNKINKEITKSEYDYFVNKYKKKSVEVWQVETNADFLTSLNCKDIIIVTNNNAYWCMNQDNKNFKIRNISYEKIDDAVKIISNGVLFYGTISANKLSIYMSDSYTFYQSYTRVY